MDSEKADELLNKLDKAVRWTLTGGNDLAPEDQGNVVQAVKEIAEVVEELVRNARGHR